MVDWIPPSKNTKPKKARRKGKNRTFKWIAGVALMLVAGIVGVGVLSGTRAGLSLPQTNTPTPLALNLARLSEATPQPLLTTSPITQMTVPPLTSSATPPLIAPDIPIDAAQLEQAQTVLGFVNADRVQRGLKPLNLNPVLIEAARVQSRDMAQGDFMSHTGSDNSDVTARVHRVGYIWSLIGENVLQRWDVNAEQAYQQWWNSLPHQDNMMNPAFTELGVAYDVAESGRVYYAMVLGTPK